MPRARAAAPTVSRESAGEFEAPSRVSSVMEDLQQIQSERRARRPRSGSGGEEMREPLVARTQPAGHSPPSPPTEAPAAGGGYFSIANTASIEDQKEKCSFVITWLLFTLLVFSVLVWMANTRKVIFASEGFFKNSIFGTCELISSDEDELPFSSKAFDWLHSKLLRDVSEISSILLSVLLFMQLVFACSRGYCALGTVKVSGRIRNTNRNVKLTRALGWLGTAAVVIAVQMSVFLVGAGFSCSWAIKKIFNLFAAVSAGSAIVLGCLEIMNHMTNYYRPKLQRHVGRVLLMVPVYALDSMLTVFYPTGNMEVGCGVVRSLWEAYTIYSFYMFVLEYLQGLAVLQVIEDEAERALREALGVEEYGSIDGGSGGLSGSSVANSPGGVGRTGSGRSSSAESVLLGDLADGGKPVVKLLNGLRQDRGEVAHIWPMNYCLKPWSGAVFLARCKSGVLQYVAWQIFCTLIALIATNIKCPHAPAETGNCYNEANPDPRYVYLWTQLTLNFSQAWALYCLTYCYKTLKDLLSPISPLGKFMCIKMVVFATFWQQTFFTILFYSSLGDKIQWCPLEECCLLPDGAGSESYRDKCDGDHQKVQSILCGFCPSKTEYMGGADYHVLENNAIQATLVCFEMLFFAIAHRRVFSWRDFVLEGEGDDAKPVARAFADMVDTRDIRGAVSWLVKSRVKETVSDGEMLVDGSIQTVRRGVDGVLGFGRNTVGAVGNTVGAVVDATLSVVPLPGANRRVNGATSQSAPSPPADLDVSMDSPAQVPPASPLVPGRTPSAALSPVHGAVRARFSLDESPPKLAAHPSGPRE